MKCESKAVLTAYPLGLLKACMMCCVSVEHLAHLWEVVRSNK